MGGEIGRKEGHKCLMFELQEMMYGVVALSATTLHHRRPQGANPERSTCWIPNALPLPCSSLLHPTPPPLSSSSLLSRFVMYTIAMAGTAQGEGQPAGSASVPPSSAPSPSPPSPSPPPALAQPLSAREGLSRMAFFMRSVGRWVDARVGRPITMVPLVVRRLKIRGEVGGR